MSILRATAMMAFILPARDRTRWNMIGRASTASRTRCRCPNGPRPALIRWAVRPMAAEYDVFLSHDGVDKAAVAAIAVRLRDAGLRPFFD